MNRLAYSLLIALGFIALTGIDSLAQTGSLQGRLTDSATGDPLAGGNLRVVLPGTTTLARSNAGASAREDGTFLITDLPVGPFELLASFIGYREARVDVTIRNDWTVTQDLQLLAEGINLNAVVVSASRQAERVVDAPASTSILTSRELEGLPATSPAQNLRNETAVDIAQVGVDRYEVVTRGFGNAFTSYLLVLSDYREASVPAFAVNAYAFVPQNFDVERIELVRGPGSALYGPGVDAGVLHFFTKSPFRSSGTTISLNGGERQSLGGSLRHAGVLGSTLGYKVTGSYNRATEWTLDPNDEDDAFQLSQDAVARDSVAYRMNYKASIEYRPDPKTIFTVQGGYNQASSTFLSGVGTIQAQDWGLTWGQVMMRAGNFFGQAYINKNNARQSYTYATGVPVVENSSQVAAQGQYRVDYGVGNSGVVFGVDMDITTPSTDGTVYGRFEDSDQIQEFGAYAQNTLALGPAFDLTAAVRVDANNIRKGPRISPRAGLVFRPTPANAFRATYNRSFSSPFINSLFLDVVGAQGEVLEGSNQYLTFMGVGARQGWSFDNFRNTKNVDFVLPLPGMFGTQIPHDQIPLQALYGLALGQFDGILRDPTQELPEALAGIQDNIDFRVTLANLLAGFTPGVLGTTSADLAIPSLIGGDPTPVSGPVDVNPVPDQISNTFEIGYRGILNRRFQFSVDGYYLRRTDFEGALEVISPFAYLNGERVTEDLTEALNTVITEQSQGNLLVAGLLNGLGLNAEQAAALLAQLMGEQLGGLPAGVVQPDQQVLPEEHGLPEGAEAVGGFLSFRSFGEVDVWGVDVSAQYLISPTLSIFGTASYVADDLFDEDEIGEPGTGLFVPLNAPKVKVKGGFSLNIPAGLALSGSARYISKHPIRSGPYVGDIDEYVVVDLGIGYDLSSFLPRSRIDVLALNVLNNEHREFVGAPRIGRMTTARLTFGF